MAKALFLNHRDSIETLRRAIASSSDEAQRTRLRAIMRLRENATRTTVARDFVVDRDTITNWIAAYNEGGIDALRMSKGGRPEGNPKWDRTVFDALIKEIDKGGRYWSVPLMQEWIKERYKQDIPENTVWYHVRALNYSYKSARPHPMKGDPFKQEAFKKGALRRRSAPHSRQEKKNR